MSEPALSLTFIDSIYVDKDGRRFGPSKLAGPREPGDGQPHDVFPALVVDHLLVARTPDAAVALTRILAYPNGFQFSLAGIVRYVAPGRYGVPEIDDPMPYEFLSVSVRFPNGRYAVEEPARRGDPLLWRSGFIGHGRRHDADYWVAPLPPPGPVTFGFDWGPFGIEGASTVIDGQLILDAAARAVQLWPYTDDRPEPGPEGDATADGGQDGARP